MLRRVTFFVIGLAPIAFLAGLLHARLARSAIGDLLVELRPTERRPPARRARARPARPVADARLLGARVPDATSTSTGSRSRSPSWATAARRRSSKRGGEHVAALVHDPSLERRARAASARVTAAAGDRARERAPAGRPARAPRASCGPRARGSSRPATRRRRSSSATCTTARSSGSSARAAAAAARARESATDPATAEELLDERARRAHRVARGAARARPRHPSRDPARPRPRRSRCESLAARSPVRVDASTYELDGAPAGAGRGRRVLPGRRRR